MPLAICLATCLLLGIQDPAPQPDDTQPPPKTADRFQPDPSWKPLGRDLWFDPGARRLILRTKVVLREGYLEHLVCLVHSKEHESVLSTEAEPRMIHAGLILAVGEPGHPVRYQPEFEHPEGPPVAITAEWKQDGKTHKLDARMLVKEAKSGKPLEAHWVFAGSTTFVDPDTKRVLYAADGGDLITVANFPSAILDVPFASSNSDAERGIVAFTKNIPPIDTPVTLYLEKPSPAPKPKKPPTTAGTQPDAPMP